MATPRTYDALLTEHLTGHRQMAFVSGPRQVGKTTTCRLHAHAYVNWDDIDYRELILSGPANLIGTLKLDRLSEAVPVLLFDELYKFPRWKQRHSRSRSHSTPITWTETASHDPAAR